jgi:hypothetical protein
MMGKSNCLVRARRQHIHEKTTNSTLAYDLYLSVPGDRGV